MKCPKCKKEMSCGVGSTGGVSNECWSCGIFIE